MIQNKLKKSDSRTQSRLREKLKKRESQGAGLGEDDLGVLENDGKSLERGQP